MKIFISYRSMDANKVDDMVARLSSLKNDDGLSRYIPWQDKHGIPAGKDWWEAIIDEIIQCQVFVFNISRQALGSVICRAELSFACQLNRPVIPIVLEGEYYYDDTKNNFELDYWDQIPTELKELRTQFLFYTGASFLEQFDKAIAEIRRVPDRWVSLNAERPADPRSGSAAKNSDIAIYGEAFDYAGRVEFEMARKLFQRLISRSNSEFRPFALEWIEILHQYERLIQMNSQAGPRRLMPGAWEKYKELFPKHFIDGIFDPKGFAAQFEPQPEDEVIRDEDTKPVQVQVYAPVQTTHEVRVFPAIVVPPPAEIITWVNISGGRVKITPDENARRNGALRKTMTAHVLDFGIGKYPVTNAQFGKFIAADGYLNPRWWSEAGWDLLRKQRWLEPRYWRNPKWNGSDYPVVGISWHESMAFCEWLSDLTGDKITLPTEQQWQRAAQGSEAFIYPWGSDWDSNRCNNSVIRNAHGNQTSSVYLYEGKSDSLEGVVDMAGNVWEWCNSLYNENEHYVLRGGSWSNNRMSDFRTDCRSSGKSSAWNNVMGFRCVRSLQRSAPGG